MTAPDPPALRHAMRNLATGVVSVTTWCDGRPWALTVSSCCSVSLEPPTVLVSLLGRSVTARCVRSEGLFGLNLLASDQIAVAELGAAPGTPKFIDVHCDRERTKTVHSPVIAGALAHLSCTLMEAVEVADHVICIALVDHVLLTNIGKSPLIYSAQRYGNFAPTPGAMAYSLELGLTSHCAEW
jgi:flavin reductase ActVB